MSYRLTASAILALPCQGQAAGQGYLGEPALSTAPMRDASRFWPRARPRRQRAPSGSRMMPTSFATIRGDPEDSAIASTSPGRPPVTGPPLVRACAAGLISTTKAAVIRTSGAQRAKTSGEVFAPRCNSDHCAFPAISCSFTCRAFVELDLVCPPLGNALWAVAWRYFIRKKSERGRECPRPRAGSHQLKERPAPAPTLLTPGA